MNPNKGYKGAKKQLEWNFGNTTMHDAYASAFMDKALK